MNHPTAVMNRDFISHPQMKPIVFVLLSRGLACLLLALCFMVDLMGQAQNGPGASGEQQAIHATHILGFETVPRNADGRLEISGEKLQFKSHDMVIAQVTVSSIQDIFLGQTDEQVGGTPMALGKAAVPFGGGRVVSLFSHKKYDSFAVEYVDSDGGLHGAIFRLSKGQAQTLKSALMAAGAPVPSPPDPAAANTSPEAKNDNQ